MSHIIKSEFMRGVCCINVQPFLQFQRYRGKINIQRPRQPHYDRALLQAVTTPVYPKPIKNATCFEILYEKTKMENPYNDIIAREVKNWFHQSKMIVIYHVNSIKSDDLFDVRVALHKQGMTLKSYGKKIITKAVAETRFETVTSLFDSNHCIVFSPNRDAKQLIKITKKVPQMILLAGIVDDKLLSHNELIAYSQLPSLQEAQSELVRTLHSSPNHLIQSLQMSQSKFLEILDISSKVNESNNPMSETHFDGPAKS